MTLPRDRESLRAALRAGQQFEYLLFWGHRPPADGAPGPWCLSQWAAVPFVVDGLRYPTAEHFMMSAKAAFFGDSAALAAIRASADPGVAKRLGRTVARYDDARWAAVRRPVVVEGNVAKFTQSPRLAHWLQGTAPRVLVEASPTDVVWGIGLTASDPRARDPEQWSGENLLGFSLMDARERVSI